MKFYFRYIFLILSIYNNTSTAQTSSTFFPNFQAYISNPIIKYGDGFTDAAWNDPCVIKQNGQYIMYISAANGITGSSPVKVYRQISSDGYNWILSPTTPVLEPLSGTYYAGGTETPSVVFKDSIYHLYLTCYPSGNVSADFVLAHATSTNGINWTMDAAPILESDGSSTIYGSLVGEPGAIVYHDSIYVFYTSAGIVSGNPIQCIGLIKSADGSIFNTPQQAVTLPLDVYPLANNYWGLSTPSALAINDSIYLFTDVAQTINGVWTQVALHQFKTDGISGIWSHDTVSIHTKQDFNWTNGTFYSEIRSITPLLDDHNLLRIWYAGNRLADVTAGDTTYHVIVDGLGNMHVDANYWGIGTSSYQFQSNVLVAEINKSNGINIFPNPSSGKIYLSKNSDVVITDVSGQLILSQLNTLVIDITNQSPGMYFLSITKNEKHLMQRIKIIKE